MSEKRIKPRMHRRIPIEVEVRFQGAASGAGRVIEMSEGGLSFASSETVTSGNKLTLTLSDEEATFSIGGSVVHASERDGEGVYGFQFEKVEAGTAAQVREMLRRHRFSRFRVPAKT